MEQDAVPDFLGLLYDSDGMLLEGYGPRTFTAMQDIGMAFRVIIQVNAGGPDGELRLSDRLWVILPDARPRRPWACGPTG